MLTQRYDLYEASFVCAQNIPIAAFQRKAANDAAPWPTTADIWYSQRVIDIKDDVPKWCVNEGRNGTLMRVLEPHEHLHTKAGFDPA